MTRLAPVGVALLVFVASLAVRLADLDRFATIDESRWIQRGADFWTLVQQRDDEDTFIIGHPGVTTMWLVGLGMGPERVERMATRPGRPDVTRRDGYLDALVAARRAFVVVGSAAIALIALLAWRLAGPLSGALTGLLLAADPFLAAHNQVAHLDATLSGLMAVVFLSAAVVWLRGGELGWLALAGAATGLALLTKAPSIYLLGALPLLAGWWAIRDGQRPWPARIGRVGLGTLLWAAIAVGVCFALWPALRVNPVGTVQKLIQFTSRVGGGEHDNFFLGQPTDDPGWLYYPIVLAFRLGLGTLGGLALAAALGGSRRQQRSVVGAATLFVLGFWLMMNLGPKRFDRYLLPLFPLLGLLAAIGWSWAARALQPRGRAIAAGAVALSLVLQLVPTLLVRPYYLSYYNPLLGGGAMAQQEVFVGWGEGLAPVADYLDAQPIVLGAPTVASSYHRAIQAHLDGSAVPLDRVSLADYVVPYVNTLQRGLEQDVLGPIVQQQEPLLVIWHNGIEYARLYRGPHYPERVSVGARYGELELVEALIAPGAMVAHPGEELQVLLRWRGVPNTPGTATVRLLDSVGQTVDAQVRTIGADGVGGNLGGAEDQSAELHLITVPPRASGAHEIMVSVGQSGPNSRLGRITIEPAARQ